MNSLAELRLNAEKLSIILLGETNLRNDRAHGMMEVQGYKNVSNEREAVRAWGGLTAYWKEDFSLHPSPF